MLGYLKVFWEQFNWSGLLSALQRVLGVLLCLTVHETCHGLTAYAMGDPTAKKMRRLSFNPLHHIDWLGLFSMLACGFGWAKPVPVDMRYFKRPKLGMAATALAGPASNFLLALLMLFLAHVIAVCAPASPGAFVLWLFSFLLTTALLSIGLGLFNLVPIPPLDGSKVLFALLPERAYLTLMRYERFGMALLLLLVWLDVGGQYLSDAIYFVYQWMAGLFF
ncbi:MAG: site-2 protease family protein [Oscillospiraceae bacterium]|nr:site-2 protease family protein [Oscillospiraceae bacterium]